LLKDKATLDPYGFIVTDPTLMTTWPGVFVAGATAALMIRQYLKQVG
jgi:thioredoxin reductase